MLKRYHVTVRDEFDERIIETFVVVSNDILDAIVLADVKVRTKHPTHQVAKVELMERDILF